MGGPGCPREPRIVGGPPAADRVEVVEREAERVHQAVTDRAARVGAVRLHPLRRCERGGAPASVFSSSGGTLAGGAGGGAPSTRSSSHLPRFTTDVRVE